ncbi:MAG: BrnT family toxin [Pseudohaliea sp.]
MKFEWDAAKNRANQRKHGLSFDEARQLFEHGDDYLEIFDEAHSSLEDRFIAIGEIQRGVAVVVYTERDEDVIRIIGARFATRREKQLYSQRKGEHK